MAQYGPNRGLRNQNNFGSINNQGFNGGLGRGRGVGNMQKNFQNGAFLNKGKLLGALSKFQIPINVTLRFQCLEYSILKRHKSPFAGLRTGQQSLQQTFGVGKKNKLRHSGGGGGGYGGIGATGISSSGYGGTGIGESGYGDYGGIETGYGGSGYGSGDGGGGGYG